MSSKPVKKVHYSASTKGSSVHGGPSPTPPLSSRPASSPRRSSISHQRHPSDSGVGSSSSNSATAAVNSTSFYTDVERSEQRQNPRALNEALNTLKDRVQSLELENRELQSELSERNRKYRDLRRESDDQVQSVQAVQAVDLENRNLKSEISEVNRKYRDLRHEHQDSLRTIEELRKELSRAKNGRDGKDSDGIRVRGSDIKITPEKKERDRGPATPPIPRREKERDSEARKREEHQARERRASHRDEDHPREKRNSGTPTSSKLPNPFTPMGPLGSNTNTGRTRRASVSQGTSQGAYMSASQVYPGMSMDGGYGRNEVPYMRGGVPVNINVGLSGAARGDDLFPNDGRYHPYPLDS
ncbi:hypothetical protein NHQ30_005884 [Ciborinia camelliae]|nr:hypothetical protein NHQ30_005884 [Ciborinia camelliae]